MLQGITKVRCELLDLKNAVENMCGICISCTSISLVYEVEGWCFGSVTFCLILKIDEVGELFEEARGTMNKNVVCVIKELHIYNAL
ncbi:hypothetical protein Bca101_067291 [Brassica carinata]